MPVVDDRASQSPSRECQLFVVGIGASAGGLDSLQGVVSHLTPHNDCCYIIIQHLSPDFESHLPEIVGRWTDLPVVPIEHEAQISGGKIFVAPAGKRLLLHEGRFLVSEKEPSGLPLPIDELFRSMAQEYGRYAVGVVVSGTGADGSRGAIEIASSDGLVIAETLDSAQFTGMPQSVIGTGICNLVLPPDSIATAIDQFVTTAISADQMGEQVLSPIAGSLDPILELLNDDQATDFSYYKQTTVERRIRRRIGFSKVQSIAEYTDLLRSDPSELKALQHDLLIGVTAFFRDSMVFDALRKDHLKRLIEELPAGQEFRAWVAGCATGEEAYSVAITVHEIFADLGRPEKAKIFATDLHPKALQAASVGVYLPADISGIDDARLNRYFESTPQGYRVRNELRQMLVFAPHNVISDAPFLRLDLVCCRNLLIYLQPHVQKRVISLFHFGLRSGGLMVLGSSETPGEMASDFETLDSKWRIYQRRSGVGADRRFSLHGRLRSPLTMPSGRGKPTLLDTKSPLLEQFMPRGILVDGNRDVIHCYDGAEELLRIPSGQVSKNISALIIESMRPAVSLAMQRIETNDVPVRVGGGRAMIDGALSEVTVTATSVNSSDAMGWVFVQFELVSKSSDGVTETELATERISDDHVRLLEDELQMTRENLQATIEELEASNEELQATNQELTASNEELQSTNEELHSVNEELFTVNTDHQQKISQLIEVTDDLNNLLSGTEVGVLFLDSELRIRKFTDNIRAVFEVVEGDVGRKISAFRSQLSSDKFFEGLKHVQHSGDPGEYEVQSPAGDSYLIRVLPYTTRARAQGILPQLIVTVIDISSVKSEEAKRDSLGRLVDQSPDFIASTDAKGIIQTWNLGAEKMIGVSRKVAVGKSVIELLGQHVEGNHFESFFSGDLNDEGQEVVEWRLKTDPRKNLILNWRAKVQRDADGQVSAISIIAHDISEIAEANRRVAASEHELRTVMESVTEGILVMDREWRYIYVNDGMCDMLDVKREEVLGKTMWEQFPETAGSEFERQFRIAWETQEPVRFEEYYQSYGRWYQCHGFPSEDRLTVFFTDTTELRVSDDLLTQQAEMLELSHDAIIAWEVDGGITFWNRGAELLYGYSKNEVLGRRTQDVLQIDNHDVIEEIIDQIREHGEWEGRLVHMGRQGEKLNVTSKHQLLRLQSDGREMVLEINRDMTEYDQLSSRVNQLASIADLTTDFVGTAKATGEIQYVNTAAAKMLGYDAPERLAGKSIDDLHPKETLNHMKSNVFSRLRNGGVVQLESDFLSVEGERIPTSQVVMAHLDSDGEVTHYSTIARDISSQKQYELQLQTMRDVAESANRAKSAFLAQMSHEIRTPMTAILGCAEQLRDASESDDAVQLSRIMVEQGNALMSILDDILDLSRIEAEKIELEYRKVNVAKVLRDLHRLMQPRADDTGLRFDLDLVGEFPHSIETDPVRLRQVIVNLLSNAFKFTPQGSVRLGARCVHTDETSVLQIEVQDSGVGIAKDDLSSIFEAFSRLQNPKASAAGTGLGLTIAHRLVGRLGGELDLESIEGTGTTFTIRLPIDSPSSTAYLSVSEATASGKQKLRGKGNDEVAVLPIHVLVAEDTDAIRFLLSKILSPVVEKLTMVENGSQAVDHVSGDDRVDVVLMDMQMPVMSGVDATRAIRQRGFDIPIIALTAGAMDADRQQCLEAGCSEFLSKPVNKRTLISLLEELAGD